MDERLSSILRSIPQAEVARAAAGALEVAGVGHPGELQFEEITTPHADSRTIGIVRVSGTALTDLGHSRQWSAVTKIIDRSVPPHWKDAVDTENEVKVYEQGLFRTAGLGFRPARCHQVSRPVGAVTVLWLEDLTDAKGPPFSLDALAQMARHLGEWNAECAAHPPAVPFPIGRDFQVRSWMGWNYHERAAQLRDMADDPMVRAMYAHQPVDLAGEFVAVFGPIVERSKVLPHGVALADCPVSNFFYRPGETVAIDWAGIGDEPVGADGGRFIGSALTWGRDFVKIAQHERELFESYAAGLSDGGYTGTRDEVRMAYLSELGFYLANVAVLPTVLSGTKAVLSHSFFEKRFGWPLDQLGDSAAGIVELLPSYVAEARRF